MQHGSNMLQNLFLIKKNFVPVKFICNIYPQHFSPSKYFIIVCGTCRPHQDETYMRQRRRQPQAVCQVGDSFSVASCNLVVSSRPWLKLCAIRKRTTVKRNRLSGFAAECGKILKMKRRFREGLSLAETEINVQFKLVCVKRRNTSVSSLCETVMSLRKPMSGRMKTKLHYIP